MDERQIERLAPELGQAAADRVDLDHVAASVVTRLRAAPRPHGTVVWRVLAVAAALTLGAGATVMSFRTSSPATTTRVVAAPLLDPLSADELEEVLDSLMWQAPVTEQLSYGLDDLDAAQLEELLAAMEG